MSEPERLLHVVGCKLIESQQRLRREGKPWGEVLDQQDACTCPQIIADLYAKS